MTVQEAAKWIIQKIADQYDQEECAAITRELLLFQLKSEPKDWIKIQRLNIADKGIETLTQQINRLKKGEVPSIVSSIVTEITKEYVIQKFLTNALIQNVQSTVRKEIFGDPDQNLTYLPKLEEVLREAGHDFEICTKTSDQVKKRLLEVLLQEKIQSLKKLN